MKILLLDIDYTTFHESTPRPFLKEFLERVTGQYNVYFFTAARHQRITEVCRILYHQLKLSDDIVQKMNRYSLSRDNCPMISHRTDLGGYIDVKCLRKAAEVLGVDISEILLIDDAPIYDNPDRDYRIQAPGFSGNPEDKYLLTLLL
ncbi:NIF family HAD-type phosphatase [Spirosoma sp.]|uniref:NIF family HAD-type phosphatase n=1 Tax=Spirosoma sp. TaxID=1899569 RepID=UPI00262319B4|nr:NIF family HAD-type phosphatase [Spirosoma sp.]MCX6216377.1 NIF family HAD-type phosphatase [Spirosoma sp.]